MAGNLTTMIAAIFSGSAVSTDPYFNLTTLLLSTTATNGQQNNTFQDSSTNNFTITRNPATGPNAPTQGTFSPFSQTGWSNYFDGTSDYLTVNDNAALELGSSNFCLEFMYYPTSSANSDFVTKRVNASSYGLIIVQTGLALQFWLSSSGSSWDLFSNQALGSVTLNAWNHLAIYRIGNAWYSSLNGTITTLSASLSGAVTNNAANWNIGGNNYASGSIIGYLSNFRLVIGSSVYTSTSAPIPTAPLTAVTNTQLLTCQSNRFVDNSANNFAVTPTGNTSVVPFSPFNPTSAWSASTVGGSGYFSGSYLTVPSGSAFNLGTNDFCIEFWLNPIAPATYGGILSFDDGGDYPLNFSYASANSSNLQANFGTTTAWLYTAFFDTSTATNEWAHYVATRSGSTFRLFKNGVLKATGTSSGTIGNSSGSIRINANGTAAGTTYISNLRIINGSIPTTYQTSSTTTGTTIFTVPTSPLTTTSQGATASDVKLLLNFTNSGIYDATAKNVLETVGNAQVSTTQSKWSPTSMYFDGTGDYLAVPDSRLFDFTSSDWTIEFWMYRTVNATQTLITKRTSNAVAGIPNIFANTSNKIVVECSGQTALTPTGTISNNVWTHVAIVRSGSGSNNVKIYFNGTADATSVTWTTMATNTSPVYIGADTNGNGYTGYLQDIRISRYARYTANFSVPTAAFPVQ